MASLFNSKHNKYVSIPDWFKDTDLSEQTTQHKTTYISGGSAVGVASGLSNIILYNKFVVEDVELDKEALIIVDTVLNTTESETIKIGDTIPLSGWSTTEYISIASGSVMVVTSYIDAELNKLYGILFYDNTLSVIGSHLLTSSPEEVSVPAGAFYFRISTTATDDFKIVYKTSKEYNEEQLLQSNNNITDYLSLNELIPEGINETSVTDNALKLLVQSPLALTRDSNNVIKLSMKQVNGNNINDMFVWDKKLAAFGYDEVSKQAYSYVDGQQQFDVDGNPVMTNDPDFWMYDENLEDKWIIKSTRSRLSWLDNLFEYDDEKNCFVLHGNLATTGGIVTYANAGDINIDNIYDGLPIDWDTIYWEEGVLKSKGNGSGIKEVIVNNNGNALTGVYWNSGDNTLLFYKDKTFAELQYVQDNFLLKSEIDVKLRKYVTIDTEQPITGKKDFTTGGLFVNGNQIVYNKANGYWLLEGDLLVTGGITSFASVSGFEPSSIMDALHVDEENLKVINGVLTFIGSTSTIMNALMVDETNLKVIDGVLTFVGSTGGGGTADSVHWDNIEGKPTWIGNSKPTYNYSEINGTPDLSKYLTSSSLDGYAMRTWVENNYLPLSGVLPNTMSKEFKLQGDLRLRSGTEYYGRTLYFGDGSYAYIQEYENDKLKFHGDKGLLFEVTNSNAYIDFTTSKGIRVNGGLLMYNSSSGYWKMEGDLLITGGITSYSSDGNATPFLINVTRFDEITSNSTTQVYTANAVSLLKTQLDTVNSNVTTVQDKLTTLRSSLSTLSATSVSALVTALNNIGNDL